MKRSSVRTVLMCIVGVALIAIQGIAVPVPATPTITCMVVGHPELGTFNYDPAVEEFEQDGKKWKLKYEEGVLHEDVWMGSADIFIEEIEYDPDPLVYHNILVSNTSGGTQTYSLTLSLNTTWSGPLVIRGSIDTSVIGPDALLEAPTGGAVYTAQIDGNDVRTLQDDPFALGTGQAATSDYVNFTWESTAEANVDTDIAIQLTFTLSDGASAAILSDFEVIPEPASLALIGITTSAIVFVRRRFIA